MKNHVALLQTQPESKAFLNPLLLLFCCLDITVVTITRNFIPSIFAASHELRYLVATAAAANEVGAFGQSTKT